VKSETMPTIDSTTTVAFACSGADPDAFTIA
jgi:hypothetical protein